MLLRPRQRVVALAAVQVGDAAFDAVPSQWLRDDLERLRFPWKLRFVFPIIKTASAVGLLAGLRWPRIGRLTTSALVAYFVLALGFHRRADDRLIRYAPAVAMLGWSLAARRAYRES